MTPQRALALLVVGPAALATTMLGTTTAGASATGARTVVGSTTPSATALLDATVTNLAKQAAITATETESGTKLHELVEPSRAEVSAEITFSGKGAGGQLDVVVIRGSLYMKGNAVGLELITLGLVPASKLAGLAGKWYKTSSVVLSFALPSFKPTLAGIGAILCLNRSTIASASTSSTATTSSSCTLAGTKVTSYSRTRAVITSKGLGDETIVLALEHGALLPSRVVSLSRTKPASLTVGYPSPAPAITAPRASSPFPANL